MFEKEFISGQVKVTCQEYVLQLRSAFGTSHSMTTTRTNALITIQVKNKDDLFIGYGEVGLPPKKKGVYLADYNDVQEFFISFCKQLESTLVYSSVEHDSVPTLPACPFQQIPSPYFDTVKNINSNKLSHVLPHILFQALDSTPNLCRAAACGIEMSILDLWCKLLNIPLYELINIAPPHNKYAFYTAALNPDIEEIEKATRFGLKYTPYLKIKLDANVEKGIEIMKRLWENVYQADEELQKSGKQDYKWTVDANAAWTPQVAQVYLQEMAKQLPQIKDKMYMIEQAFPVDLDEIEQCKNEWIQFKNECEKHSILVFADESVSTSESIVKMQQLVHGVNIKLEKAGGIREAVKAILKAKELNLKVWLGMMVATNLSSTASAHLMSLSEIGGDLDGALLTTDESQILKGGFVFGAKGGNAFGEIQLSRAAGIGLVSK